jgi:hypothetical protein
MASFDIIAAAGQGYKVAWDARAYFAKLCVIPVLIKMVCHAVTIAFGWETDFIRQALVMLPSYFADGWLLAHVARLVFLDERAPPVAEEERARLEIRRGMIAFVVIHFLLAGFSGLVHHFGQDGMEAGEMTSQTSPLLVGAGLAAMLLLIWAFRFLWIYIPAAIGYPIRSFVAALGGYTTSVYMIGTWLICIGPLLFAFTAVALGLLYPFEDGSAPAAVMFCIGIRRCKIGNRRV